MAAVACLCAGAFAPAAAQAQTTNFYLWRTTITVGEASGYLGYHATDSLGSISTGAQFNYPPWSPPHKHHVDPAHQFEIDGLYIDPSLKIALLWRLAVDRLSLPKSSAVSGSITLLDPHHELSYCPAVLVNSLLEASIHEIPDLDWEEDDEVRVALVYERTLPSAPTNVRVTAPPGEEGTLEVSWDEADDGTFPIECYLVEFRHPSGEARDRKQSYPGSLGTGEGCGDSPPTSVKRTDLETGVEYQVLVQALSGDGFSEWSETKTARIGGRSLRAWFESPPERHDGKKRVKVQVAFSEPIDGTPENVGQHGVDVEGGDVTSARKVGGNAPGGAGNRSAGGRNAGREDREVVWEFEIEPDSNGDVTVSLDAGRPCGEPGAICTADGRSLSEGISTTVEGPDTGPAGLTAAFEGLPVAHRGEGGFHFRVAFSEDIGISFRSLREDAFTVTGGRVTGGKRVDGRRDLFRMTVRPDSDGAVTITLPAGRACGVSGAICTKGKPRRPLTNSPSATVGGPVGIAVADARVDEGAGALLAFAVTLSRAASGTLTVDYQTADGSAHAGVDYTAASGTLTFQTGESSQTITVAVLDDAHDEGEETLTLTLSNVSGGHLTDGEATGTIDNADPLPRALLARFGRTAAVHVVEHVEERLAAPRAPGIEGRVAGRELRPGMEREMALSFLSQLGSASGVHPVGMGSHEPLGGSPAGGMGSLGTPGRAAGTPMAAAGGSMMGVVSGLGATAGPLGGAFGPDGGLNGGGLLQMGLGGGDLLTGSAFAMNRETRHGGILSFWSRGARSSFAGREGALSLGGDVRTTMAGADYAKGPLVAGLSLSHSRGLGEYAGVAGGQVTSSVTGLYPWLGYKATDRVTVWGVAGYGAGGLRLTPQGGPALEAGLSMAMAAAGTRGELVAGGSGGFALAFKADALWVGTSIDGVDGAAGRLQATAAAVTRFRTGLEGSRAYTLAGRLSLTPSVEVGLRHDGGDAETGAGMDVGAGLIVADASTGLAVDVRVRTLVMHQAEGFRERGVAVSLSYNPTPSTPLGFVARVAPSWGGEATSGAEALWGRETMAGMAHGGLAQGNRLDGEVGYGLPVGSRLVGTPTFGVGTSEMGRDYRLGYRLGALGGAGTAFELGVEAQRRESPVQGGTDHGALARATVRW